MELIYFDQYLNTKPLVELVITIGDFDGVHSAHKVLLDNVVKTGKSLKMKTAVLTFFPHPITILNNSTFQVINNLEDKCLIMEKWNIDYLIIIPFTHEFSRVSPQDFVNNYLKKINVKEVIVGYDFKFGHKGSGVASQITELSDYSIHTHILEKIVYNSEKISSSKIRFLLNEGLIEEANQLLGHNYFFSGIVCHGRHIGRTINLPTANLFLDKNIVKLKKGVYAVAVIVDNVKYYGMMNVGNNPTFNFTSELSYEINIFDFSLDIYDKKLIVICYKYIRSECKFSSKDEFLKQINLDREIILGFFKHNKNKLTQSTCKKTKKVV